MTDPIRMAYALSGEKCGRYLDAGDLLDVLAADTPGWVHLSATEDGASVHRRAVVRCWVRRGNPPVTSTPGEKRTWAGSSSTSPG